jgi:hypothetical protein
MMISCLTYIQGFPVKIAISTNFPIVSNLIKIHLKILSLNFVPINDRVIKSWKTKISSINLLSHVSNTGSGEPLVVIFLSIKAINYISYLNW